jgi:magnesium chelatase family protein
MSHGVYGATMHGARARLVRVEAETGRGLPRTVLSGMPDVVAREARERLPSALAAHGYQYPRGKVLFNLVPAQLPKTGLPLDLALAAAVLVADGQWPAPRFAWLCVAELDLQGRLGPPSRGTLLAALAAARAAQRGRALRMITAAEAASEACLAPSVSVHGCRDLAEVAACFAQADPDACVARAEPREAEGVAPEESLRLDDVRGQAQAREALALAALGGHALWMQGPPGSGKSMLARRLPLLLEDLDPRRALELAQVEALLGPVRGLPRRPPLRAPHVSASAQALLGGGAPLRPGEISRAHGGVLFLDEFPEFARPVLEGLRQPLEEREVRLQRAREWARFPAEVQLVAASNPCPCGYLGHPRVPCRCGEAELRRYRARISGPLEDRFDLFVEVGAVAASALDAVRSPPSDEAVRAQLAAARAFQRESAAARGFVRAAEAELEGLQRCGVDPAARALLREAAEALSLSGRGVLRTLRVARTIADLGSRERIGVDELRGALKFRLLPSLAEAATAPDLPPALAALLRGSAAARARRPLVHPAGPPADVPPPLRAAVPAPQRDLPDVPLRRAPADALCRTRSRPNPRAGARDQPRARCESADDPPTARDAAAGRASDR